MAGEGGHFHHVPSSPGCGSAGSRPRTGPKLLVLPGRTGLLRPIRAYQIIRYDAFSRMPID